MVRFCFPCFFFFSFPERWIFRADNYPGFMTYCLRRHNASNAWISSLKTGSSKYVFSKFQFVSSPSPSHCLLYETKNISLIIMHFFPNSCLKSELKSLRTYTDPWMYQAIDPGTLHPGTMGPGVECQRPLKQNWVKFERKRRKNGLGKNWKIEKIKQRILQFFDLTKKKKRKKHQGRICTIREIFMKKSKAIWIKRNDERISEKSLKKETKKNQFPSWNSSLLKMSTNHNWLIASICHHLLK